MRKEKIKSDQKQVQGEVGATRKARSKLQNGNLEGDEISVETTSVKTGTSTFNGAHFLHLQTTILPRRARLTFARRCAEGEVTSFPLSSTEVTSSLAPLPFWKNGRLRP